jgi:hypothetical protein
MGIPSEHCRARLAGLITSAIVLLLVGCTSSGLYLSDEEVLRMDREIQRLQRDNAELRAVLIEAELAPKRPRLPQPTVEGGPWSNTVPAR